VRLDEAVVPLAEVADLGVPWRYRIGPADRDHADPTVVEVTATAELEALKPLSPVHVKARRGADGVRLAWIRRTRQGGDSWEALEVPLGEESERYEVDLLQGAATVRTLTSAMPEILYPAAQELADFGAPQAAFTLRVAQLSAAVGRGFLRTATVPVI
jgi:hypothetical protein